MIKLNSKEINFKENENLYDFLLRNNFDPSFVAVEVDEKLVKRENFKSFYLKDFSKVEVFSFVGGGWFAWWNFNKAG